MTTGDRVLWSGPPTLQDAAQLPTVYRDSARLLRAKYGHLYDLPVVEHADGSRSFHEGRLYRRHGLNVLLLRGDHVEMAFQHGRLLADQIPFGALLQSAKLVTSAIENTLGRRGPVQQHLIANVQRFLTRRLFASSARLLSRVLGDGHTLPEALVLSEATGLSIGDVIQAIFNPELLLMLATQHSARFTRWHGAGVVAVPPLGCSSFAAWGSCTVDGEIVIGRNMDYPLNGFYDRFPTVIYFEPTDAPLRYMSFVSAGVHNAGITSYNEAGIFLSSHVVPCTDVSVRGVPAIIAADQIIRRASDFASAADLFRRLPPPVGWAYLLASIRERKIGSLEMSNRHFAVRPAEGEYHIQTNHFLSAKLRSLNLFLNRSVDEDSEARFQRIRERLMEARGRLDANEALSILGDQVDPLVDEVRGVGNTVGVHTTLTSIVIDPKRGRALVATGPAPACHSDYLELPLIGTFNRDDFPNISNRVVNRDGFGQTHPQKLAAEQTFIQAKIAYEVTNDVAQAYRILKDVVKHDPSNPAYFFQLGIFALKNDRFDEAIEAFSAVFRTAYLTGQLRRLAYYYRARTFAQLGRKTEAQADLAVVLGDAGTDPKLRGAAQQVARRVKVFGRFALRKRSLAIMMQQSDMLNY